MWACKEIVSVVHALTLGQVTHVLHEMQSMLKSDPLQARALLVRYPQLRYALTVAMLRVSTAGDQATGPSEEQLLEARDRLRLAHFVDVNRDWSSYQPQVGVIDTVSAVGQHYDLGAVGTGAGGYVGAVSHAYTGTRPTIDPARAQAIAVVSSMTRAQRQALIDQLRSLTEEQIEMLDDSLKQQLMVLVELEQGQRG